MSDDIYEIIESSGCSDIQEAITAITEAGFSLQDLDTSTLNTVLETIASAESVGGQAAPTH